MFSKHLFSFLIYFSLAVIYGCGNSDSTTVQYAKYAPAESPHQYAYFRYPTAPSEFTAVVGWMQSIDIKGTGVNNTVEVDWMKLHAIINGVDTVIFEDTFDKHTPEMDYYALYKRSPWFEGDNQDSMPFTVQNSIMIMNPSNAPNRIFHWWNTKRSPVPTTSSRIWFEAKIRITGGAGVQAGIDYWKDLTAPYSGLDVNNTEAGVSDWLGNSTSDWQIISVGRP